VSNKQKTDKLATEGITLRVEKETLTALKKEAKEKQVSTNTLISQIFRQHLDWHTTASRAGFVSVRKGTIRKVLENISEQEVKAIAQHIATREAEDFVLLLRNEYTLSSAMDVIEKWIRISGYSYRDVTKAGVHSFVIQHDLGRKWSVYLSEIYRLIFEEFEQRGSKFSLTDNTVHISFQDA
jgi:hypothetical protein